MVRRNIASFLLVSVMALFGAAATAQTPVVIAHVALEQKIVKDAGDRRGVRFITTHSRKIDAFRRSITGEGVFKRKGKAPQHFAYDVDVNVAKKITTRVNYNIH